MSNIDYKFNEDKILEELRLYIDKTYSQHYSRDKFQAMEFIVDSGHGLGFTIGNIMKYAQRAGKKGSVQDTRKDLLKTIHYSMLALYVHDLQTTSEKTNKFVFEGVLYDKDPKAYVQHFTEIPLDTPIFFNDQKPLSTVTNTPTTYYTGETVKHLEEKSEWKEPSLTERLESLRSSPEK